MSNLPPVRRSSCVSSPPLSKEQQLYEQPTPFEDLQPPNHPTLSEKQQAHEQTAQVRGVAANAACTGPRRSSHM